MIRPVAALLLAIALSGCASLQMPSDIQTHVDRVMASFAELGRSESDAREDAPEEAVTPSTLDAAAERPEMPVPQTAALPEADSWPSMVDARPERFIALSAADVDAELGAPARIRQEGPARVWQYRTRTCVLDLVLYSDPDGEVVRHLEARDPVDATPQDTQACLRTLLQRRALAVTG
ncbi:hypothetical protein CKO21_06635 [Rhodovibrio salinarum]|uniref:Beta-barrel assembly machine subunit BamC n=1 Tax=Rhodovibrio salinarum TaxID=1087 RepID=A0A934QHF3_9PROT|nr:hypothetical protein [Rhodovibrio salinarum]